MIEINNLTTSQVNKKFLEKIAEVILKKEKIREINLSIALVGQERIKALNKKYRKKNKPTDVLSFAYRARRSRAKVKEENKVFFAHDDLGEIVICLREVKKNAKKFKSTYKKELAQVIIHGILHLLGYTHEKSKKEAEKMEEKQNYYLRLCQKII